MFILSTKTLLWLVKEINDLHGLNREVLLTLRKLYGTITVPSVKEEC